MVPKGIGVPVPLEHAVATTLSETIRRVVLTSANLSRDSTGHQLEKDE
jgi:tRNA A37 threonylcarbamoyladenosine synthetase subunit TsaC/SUA5/YrdC